MAKVTRKGDIIQIGSDYRVERAVLAGEGEEAPADAWHLYGKVDVKDDPDTTYDYRYDKLGTFDTEAEATDEAQRLASKG